MSLGRRKIRVDDQSDWVFNRVADEYSARPAYPEPLIDALAALATTSGGRTLDLGAGIGHVALPLAARGLDVTAVEPAEQMLERLRAGARERGVELTAIRAAAEALPLATGSIGLVIVADALHFLDKELAGAEIARVLAPRGALALVTSEFGDTPFMRGVVAIMEEAAPRRPRAVAPAIAQVAATARVRLTSQRFLDETRVDAVTLERILGSISFIGPAMNAERARSFRALIHALTDTPAWARSFTLHSGRRGPSDRRLGRA
jgi:ubiquinone/menaquinone biosynthesis C-methylase UbiE